MDVCVYVHHQVMDEETKIFDKISKIFNDTPLWSEQGRRKRSRNHLPKVKLTGGREGERGGKGRRCPKD